MASTAQPGPSPQVSKQMEKALVSEGKHEESDVRHLLNDLAKTEKEHAKAQKSVHKADDALAKAQKKELKATKAAHKASHEHDITVANLHRAEQEEEMRKRTEAKLLQEVQAKKAQADVALKDQEMHNKTREAKLAEMQHTPNVDTLEQGGQAPAAGAQG
ncbi:hypothetical protein H0H87_004404 [Tephrocybe sp. NHM501043]|nr:hypothetical protein H0H87_004404 [Tephrocybe sp. NHM501043]